MLPKSYPLFKCFSTGFSTICWLNLNFYVQNKILSPLKKNYPQIFFGITMIATEFKISSPNPMNPNETKKDLNPEIKKELGKSKLQVLTNENDFLVKNLKKAGWSNRTFKYFSNNKLFKLPFKDKKIFSWMITDKIFSLLNIKFLLNIQTNYSRY